MPDSHYPTSQSSSPLLIVISGPSGVGKDSTVHCMAHDNLQFHFVVTATDRPRRDNEVDGVDYIFLTTAQFEEMIYKDELLEWAHVYGQYKGIPRQQVQRALQSGKDVVMRVDVQGAATIRRLCPDALTIFLVAENENELIRRLKERKADSEGQIQERIRTAKDEMKHIAEYDYVVINRLCQLEQTVEAISAIIKAEHHRTNYRKVNL